MNLSLQAGTVRTEQVSYTDEITATNRYTLEGIADVTLWCGGDATIDMDRTEFESKNDILTLNDIFNNLNDGQFGVQSINGANELYVEQIFEVIRKYDNGKISRFEITETVVDWQTLYRDKKGELILE